jgi:hypothetical protein
MYRNDTVTLLNWNVGLFMPSNHVVVNLKNVYTYRFPLAMTVLSSKA